MTMHKTRPIEAFQQVLNAFKTFEKKLDKLQDDVSSHGHALSDLQSLVSNLALGLDPKMNQLIKSEAIRSKKSTAVQYDTRVPPMEGVKTKRKNTIQSLPSKTKSKSYPAQTLIGMRSVNAEPAFGRQANSMPKIKHTPRLGKASSPRKATTLRAQKGREKTRTAPKTK